MPLPLFRPPRQVLNPPRPDAGIVKCSHCGEPFKSQIYLRDIVDKHHWTACPACYWTVAVRFIDEPCDTPHRCPHTVIIIGGRSGETTRKAAGSGEVESRPAVR